MPLGTRCKSGRGWTATSLSRPLAAARHLFRIAKVAFPSGSASRFPARGDDAHCRSRLTVTK
jgi:hypothetical protein